jgi:predicted XRE-type DNA-binding protein
LCGGSGIGCDPRAGTGEGVANERKTEIEDTPEEAANMKPRSPLTMALDDPIMANGWTQQEAARRLRVTQPRISDPMRARCEAVAVLAR